MKKSKIILTVALVLVLLACSIGYAAIAAGSEPAVIYNGSTQKIEFQDAWPFGSNEEPDLFSNLKGLMPGDTVMQEITIGAKNMGPDTVRIHLRAENPNADYMKLVHTYGHWVDLVVKTGDQDITGNLGEGILLGTFNGNKKSTVTVELAIDLEAGNELQNLVAEVDWIFTAEVLPGTTFLPNPSIDGNDLPYLERIVHINYLIGYEDGTVRPDAPITRAEVATIFYRLLTDEARENMWNTSSIYPDVTEDAWYYLAVCTLTNGGILEGYPDGTFRPNEPITRAELATVIGRFDIKYGEVEITDSFPDVKKHWAKGPVEFAATRKYVIGYPDGTFKPDQNITRAETVTMINRSLHRVVDKIGLLDEYTSWRDNLPGTWYYYEILEAGNYSDYVRSDREVEDQTYRHEDWTDLLDPIDWVMVERKWIKLYTGK